MENYTFGVEIEMIAKPHTVRDPLHTLHALYYSKIAASLRKRNLKAKSDTLDGPYDKRPEHYDKWWITRDGSLKLSNDEKRFLVPIEAVSPILSVRGPWKAEIDVFWTAVGAVFHQPKRSPRCGSHIHISKGRWTLVELKTIAFGVVAYETHITNMLMGDRTNNDFCRPNSKSSLELRRCAGNLPAIARTIAAAHDTHSLCKIMQFNRYVLWNFENTLPGKSGTIEFRGGRFLRGPVRTKRWIAFAVALVHWLLLAKHIRNPHLVSNDAPETFYTAIKNAAASLAMQDLLPQTYAQLNETER